MLTLTVFIATKLGQYNINVKLITLKAPLYKIQRILVSVPYSLLEDGKLSKPICI